MPNAKGKGSFEKDTFNDEEVVKETQTSADTPDEENTKEEKKSKSKGDKSKKESKTNEFEKKHQELYDQHQRVLAEYANYKRRTDLEKDQIGAFTKAEILKALIPAIESLENAVSITENADEKVAEGMKLTLKQVTDILTGLGLEVIDPINGEFNPELHNAVMRVDAEGDADGKEIVVDVFQKGYKCGDRILRPAMVKVAN